MGEVSCRSWLASLMPGDIGLNLSKNPFAYLQSLYHKKYGEGVERASHGFIVARPPEIIEANGIFVKRDSIEKFIGGNKKVWIFRSVNATEDQIALMLSFVEGARRSGGHYSVVGILQFGLQYLGVRKKISDESGVFCTELTGRAILQARLPYTPEPPHAVTPSDQLQWFLSVNPSPWRLAQTYDGDKYLISP